MSEKNTNRRSFSRVMTQIEVEAINEQGERITGWVEDVSLKGAFLPCDNRWRVGTRCEMHLFLGGRASGVQLTAKARIARVHDTGLAVEFTGMESASRQHLNSLVRYNATAHLRNGNEPPNGRQRKPTDE